MDCDKAITFLGQCWEQTSLGGVHPNPENDRISKGDEDDQQHQAKQGTPPPHRSEAPRRNQDQAGQLVDQP